MVDEKIEAPAKISSRHPAAAPKDDGITPWAVKGELILNCNCTIFCPCVVSLGKHAPTEGYCQACLLYTSPSPRDPKTSRMPSSA